MKYINELPACRIEFSIRRIFDYFNGKINVINYPAKLIIDWNINEGSNILGCSMDPSIVVIYPYSIMIRDDNHEIDRFYFEVTETIIHELYHTDQVINYNLDVGAPYEYPVEAMTGLYLYNNLERIENDLGIRFSQYNYREYIDVNWTPLFQYIPNYVRRTPIAHIATVLSEFWCLTGTFEELIGILLECINNKLSFIVLVNNYEYLVIDSGFITPIGLFNEYCYEYLYNRREFNGIIKMKYNDKYKRYELYILGQFFNTMCVEVKK